MVVETNSASDSADRSWSDWFNPKESHIKFNWVDLGVGQTLFCQGAEADSVFIVISGLLHFTSRKGATVEQFQLRTGQLIGERDVTTGRTRSATAVAKEDTCLIRITSEEYLRLKKRRIWSGSSK